MFSVHSLQPGAVTSASHEVFTYNCHGSQNRQRRPPTPPLTAHLLPLGAPARDHGGWGHSPSQTGRACKVAGEGSGQVAWELTKSLPVERPAQSPFLPCRPLGGHLGICRLFPRPTTHPRPRPPPPTCTTGAPGWPALAGLSDRRVGGGRGRCSFPASTPHGSSSSALGPLPPSQPSGGLCLLSSLQRAPPNCAVARWGLGNVLSVRGNRALCWVPSAQKAPGSSLCWGARPVSSRRL